MMRYGSLNRIIIHAMLIGGALVMIVPYMWMITLSLKPKELTYSKPYLIPTTLELSNYREAWQAASFDRYYLNSAIVTAGITVGQLLACSLAAYAFARLRFPGKEIVFLLFLATMIALPLIFPLFP